MLSEFLATIPLFYETYLSGFLSGLVLSFVGIMVLARGQVFVGVAVSHISLLGLALGLSIGAYCGAGVWVDSLGHAVSVGGSLLALYFLSDARARQNSEAWTAWVYLLGASGALVVLSQSPYGLEEVKKLLTSSLIGADGHDLQLIFALALSILPLLFFFLPQLTLRALDCEQAQAQGVNSWIFQASETLALGTVLSICIGVTGVLFTFGALLLPALGGRELSGSFMGMFISSPLCFVFACIPGFIIAHELDIPPGPMIIFLLSLEVFLLRVIGRNARAMRRASLEQF